MAEKHRLNIELNEEAYKILEELSSSIGKTKAETLRQALILRDFVETQRRQGKSLAVTQDGNVEKEIVLS